MNVANGNEENDQVVPLNTNWYLNHLNKWMDIFEKALWIIKYWDFTSEIGFNNANF